VDQILDGISALPMSLASLITGLRIHLANFSEFRLGRFLVEEPGEGLIKMPDPSVAW
jgi:hypothetical protein